MSQVAVRNTTIARLSFFTHDLIANRIDDFDLFDIPGSGFSPKTASLISFSYNKRLGACSGSISITLKARKESFDLFGRQGKLWTDLVKIGDWWMIEIYKNEKNYVLAFGIVDSIGLNVSVGGSGSVESVVSVMGRDFGFGLEDTPVYFNPYDPTIDNAAGINMIQILKSVTGNPGAVVQAIIRGFMGVSALPAGVPFPPGVSWGLVEAPLGIATLPGSPWGSVLNSDSALLGGTVQDRLRGGTLLTSLITPTSGGSVWDLVQSWANLPMNEVFVDVSPLKGLLTPSANLVVREKPFENLIDTVNSPWFKLTTWDVDARLLSGLNLNQGGNRFNYIQMIGDLKPVLQENSLGAYLPVVNQRSIRRYGLKRLQESTIYFDGDSILPPYTQLPFSLDYRAWLFNLLSWNILNHKYWLGSITTPEIRGEIHVGERIRLTNIGTTKLPYYPLNMTFYVESVQHSYSTGASPRMESSFQVSRGYPDELRLIDMAAEAIDWSITSVLPSPSVNSPVSISVLKSIEQFLVDRNIGLPVIEPPTTVVVK